MAVFTGYFGCLRGGLGQIRHHISGCMRVVRARLTWPAITQRQADSTAPLIPTLALGSMDERMITAMRLTLAATALLVVYFDPSNLARNRELTCVALVLYLVYSIVLYAMARHYNPLLPATMTHWIDVGWYVIFSGLGSGTNSIFFLFFFFAILVASFRWGFTTGLSVTLVSAALFTSMVFTTAVRVPTFNLNLFLLRSISLVVIGYMMAYWGGSENLLKQQLALLKDVSTLSNPRFGVDRTFGSIMERLRTFYDADTCLLVILDQSTGGYNLYRARRQHPEVVGQAEPLTDEAAHRLLALPATYALVYNWASRLREWWGAEATVYVCDVRTATRVMESPKMDEVCIAASSTASCITVPVRHRGETCGRLYLNAMRRRTFAASDVTFLLQVLDHTMPAIDNIRLVDRLASDAAEAERQRIARDLHDSVIQPYIGLQLGLAAIRQKLMKGSVDVQDDIERVSQLTRSGITELRRYVGELKDSGEHDGGLVSAVQRFGRKFTEATRIVVRVEAATPIPVSDRLAAEVFQMVAEGLSNVRRHTSSAWATIRLACHNDSLILHIENDNPDGTTPVAFFPRSITERATALGGNTHVEWNGQGETVVIIEIPL